MNEWIDDVLDFNDDYQCPEPLKCYSCKLRIIQREYIHKKDEKINTLTEYAEKDDINE